MPKSFVNFGGKNPINFNSKKKLTHDQILELWLKILKDLYFVNRYCAQMISLHLININPTKYI